MEPLLLYEYVTIQFVPPHDLYSLLLLDPIITIEEVPDSDKTSGGAASSEGTVPKISNALPKLTNDDPPIRKFDTIVESGLGEPTHLNPTPGNRTSPGPPVIFGLPQGGPPRRGYVKNPQYPAPPQSSFQEGSM